jgi:hypothetical protein
MITMERIQIINYQGKKILSIDFSNLQTVEEIAALMKEIKEYIHIQPPLSVYSLTNIEGMHFNNTIKDMFSEIAKSNKPFVRAGAIVGVTGLKQILFNGIMKLSGRDLKCFSAVEPAKNWLVMQN